MDLSTNSIGWHRTRQWLDFELDRVSTVDPQDDYHNGFLWGQFVAYAKVRARFNSLEESIKAEETRKEMFG